MVSAVACRAALLLWPTLAAPVAQEDYQQAVKEIDAKLFGNMQLICAELRNNYVSRPVAGPAGPPVLRLRDSGSRSAVHPRPPRQSLLHDHITKNLEKIKHPRSSRGSAMVY